MTPTQAKAAYAALVSQIAAQRDEFTHPQQLGSLTNEQRALIVEANADLMSDIDLTAEGLADVFRGNVTSGMYVSAISEPAIRRQLFWDVQQQCEKERELLQAQRFDACNRPSADQP